MLNNKILHKLNLLLNLNKVSNCYNLCLKVNEFLDKVALEVLLGKFKLLALVLADDLVH